MHWNREGWCGWLVIHWKRPCQNICDITMASQRQAAADIHGETTMTRIDSLPTDWDQIRAAAASQDVLRLLVERYTRRLWKHARLQWRNLSETDLEDFVQSFLLKLMSGKVFLSANPDRGRFRTYFLRCFDHHVCDALKTGPAAVELGELELAIGRSSAVWAEELFRLAADAMQNECLEEGNERLWGIAADRFINPILNATSPVPYEELAHKYNLKDTTHVAGAVRSARKKLVACIRQTIASYTQDESEIEAEIGQLISTLPQHLSEASSQTTASEFLCTHWQFDLQRFYRSQGKNESLVPLASPETATYIQLFLSGDPPFTALLAVRDMAKSWISRRDVDVPTVARKVLYYGLSANSIILFNRRITTLTDGQLIASLQQILDHDGDELTAAVTERIRQRIAQLSS